MALISVTATITLDFDTEESFVQDEQTAREEMIEYLATGPSPGEYDYTVTTTEE